MSSPYLDHVRHTREIILQLIAKRQQQLSRLISATVRGRVERDLLFLGEELLRLACTRYGDQSPEARR